MERREFLERNALGIGGPAMASTLLASASAEAAGEATKTPGGRDPSADMMRENGRWNTAWDSFFDLDPLWTDQFFAAVGGIYDGKTLQPKFVELLSLALDAWITHMYAPGTRRHIKAALAIGATMEEIMEAPKVATCFQQETINMAIPISAEEVAASEKRK